jgi:hypothetical protein
LQASIDRLGPRYRKDYLLQMVLLDGITAPSFWQLILVLKQLGFDLDAKLIRIVDHVHLADRVILLNANGSLAFSGNPQSTAHLETRITEVFPTEEKNSNIIDDLKNENPNKPVISPKPKPKEQQEDPSRQLGDISIWWYYARSIGAWRVIAAMAIITVNVVASNLPSTYISIY